MPRIATVSLRDLLGRDVMTRLARFLCAPRREPRFVDQDVEDVDDLGDDPSDPELEPFRDWDAVLGKRPGFFQSDADECASRRVDLRGPTDLDPGPLPMEDASDVDADQAEWLHF